METLKVKLVGESPLLMHSDRFTNPLDPATKKHKSMTSKKKKTDEDHEAIAKSEWMASLYFDTKVGPFLPTTNIRASIAQGARLHKLGVAIDRGTLILSDKAAVSYVGTRVPEEMWSAGEHTDARSVVVGTSRVMRYRPVFSEWSVTVEMLFDPTLIEREQLVQCIQNAGRLIGVGDFRPGKKGGPFGRYSVEVLS